MCLLDESLPLWPVIREIVFLDHLLPSTLTDLCPKCSIFYKCRECCYPLFGGICEDARATLVGAALFHIGIKPLAIDSRYTVDRVLEVLALRFKSVEIILLERGNCNVRLHARENV